MCAECVVRKARFWEKKQYNLIGTFHWKNSLDMFCVEEEEEEVVTSAGEWPLVVPGRHWTGCCWAAAARAAAQLPPSSLPPSLPPSAICGMLVSRQTVGTFTRDLVTKLVIILVSLGYLYPPRPRKYFRPSHSELWTSNIAAQSKLGIVPPLPRPSDNIFLQISLGMDSPRVDVSVCVL